MIRFLLKFFLIGLGGGLVFSCSKKKTDDSEKNATIYQEVFNNILPSLEAEIAGSEENSFSLTEQVINKLLAETEQEIDSLN